MKWGAPRFAVFETWDAGPPIHSAWSSAQPSAISIVLSARHFAVQLRQSLGETLMFAKPPAPELISRYLAALGVSRREPTLEALRELVAAQLTRVPFENISKLYNRKHHDLADVPPLQLYLEGIERY